MFGKDTAPAPFVPGNNAADRPHGFCWLTDPSQRPRVLLVPAAGCKTRLGENETGTWQIHICPSVPAPRRAAFLARCAALLSTLGVPLKDVM